jgi:26S proteasome regulatory subunit N10
MKKNKVAIDIVSFGEDGENSVKLQAFVNAANSGDNSHYLSIPTKPYVVLTEELAGSPIFGASMAMAGGAGDDDLEMAIRLSLQDQGAAVPGGAAAPGGAAPAGNANAMAVDDEDALMAQAIAMSMGGAAPQQGDIDEDMELAIRLSMQDSMDTDSPADSTNTETAPSGATTTQETPKPKEEEANVDSEFIQSLVSNLDGVDPNDPHFQELVASLKKEQKDKDEKKEEDK